MPIRLTLVGFLVTLSALPAVAGPKGEDGVVARLVWEPGLVGAATPGRIPFQDAPPQGTTPPTGLTKPRYARIVMAGTKGLSVVLDALPESPRLWVDSDFDRDLTDEKRVWLKKSGSNHHRTQSLLIRYGDEEEPTPLDFHFRYMPSKEPDYVQVFANVHRRGTVVLGGRLRLVALVDGRADLRFDDPEKDRIYIDLDGDGRFSATSTRSEQIVFGEPFRVGAEGWIAKTSTLR